MDERVLRFRVGVVVLAAAIITVILITLLGAWPSPFKPRITVDVVFASAPGVTIDTPVRKSGIQIGRVSDVKLLEDGKVRLTLKIEEKFKLPRDQVCRISTGSMVTGDAVVEWVSSDAVTAVPSDVQFIADGDYFENGEVAPDPFEVISRFESRMNEALVSIQGAGDSIGSAGYEVEQVARSLNTILGRKEGDIEQLIEEALLAMQNFNRVMADLQVITGDEQLQSRLKGSLEQIADLFDNAKITLAEAQETLRKFGAVAVRADHNLANLENLTEPLGARGEEISQNVVDSIESINGLLANLKQLSQSLNNEQGTIGQLINNPELYQRVNRTTEEIEKLIRKLEPILSDFRILSDKLARDPGQLGVRGALDRRQTGTGLKWPSNYTPPR